MAREIYVNLPVKDVNANIAFFTKLGFTFNQQFTNEQAACLVIGDNIFAMLVSEAFFKTFTNKEIADASKSTEVLMALSVGSRAEVDEMMDNAVAAGGSIPKETQDHGWMYSRSFQDLEGHLWEAFYMDPAGMPQA